MKPDRILADGTVVHRCRLRGWDYFTAWEPTAAATDGSPYRHTTITHFDGLPGPYGQIASDVLPAAVDALPGGSPQRIAQAAAWRSKHVARAYSAILQVHPYLHGAERYRGEIGPVAPPDACPGCAAQPGDGVTTGCTNPMGCGAWQPQVQQ